MENDKKIIAAIQKNLPEIIAIYRFGSAGTMWERPDGKEFFAQTKNIAIYLKLLYPILTTHSI